MSRQLEFETYPDAMAAAHAYAADDAQPWQVHFDVALHRWTVRPEIGGA